MVLHRAESLFKRIRAGAARLPWRRLALGLALVVTVPPLRRAVAFGTSRVILWLASPITPFVPDFDRLPDTTTVLAADGSELAALSGEDGRRRVVALDAVPEHVRRAVLAAEDAHFYEHSGVNPLAIGRAVVRTAFGDTQGGSTITQQLAKLNYTGKQRSLFRKVREVFYASALEARYSKDDLLRRYLNQVYFGEGAYGIHAASSTFFGVEPAGLTPAQGATLAAKIRAPSGLEWFVGYVPQLASAVWVGHDPGRPMTDVEGRMVTGGSFPAAIFGDLMRAGLDGVPVRRLPVSAPDGLGLERVGEPPPPPPTTGPSTNSTTTATEPTTTTAPSTDAAPTTTTTLPPTTTTRTARSPSTTTTSVPPDDA